MYNPRNAEGLGCEGIGRVAGKRTYLKTQPMDRIFHF